MNHLPTTLVALTLATASANPVPTPYTNDFTRDASDFWAPSGNGYNWGWDWRDATFQNWVSAANRTVTATMEARDLTAPTGFVLRLTVDPLEMSSASQSLGLGACGSDRTLGTSYIADVKPRGNTVRLLRNTSPLVAERPLENLDLTDLEPFTLELVGTYSGGDLTLTFTVTKDGQSDTLTATDTNPLRGTHFGLRNRNTSGRFEAHVDDYLLTPHPHHSFTSIPPLVAPVDQPYTYTPTTTGGLVTAITAPSWLTFAAGTLTGTPSPDDAGHHHVVLETSTGQRQAFHLLVPAIQFPHISEFMANNDDTLRDADGDASDWIEIFNPTPAPQDISGFHLSDDPAVPTKWTFPENTVLPPLGFLVVFASGKDQPGHANFAVDADGGALLFTDPAGPTQTITYPRQRQDIAFAQDRYLLEPTPGAPNAPGPVSGSVADTEFTVDRGFFTEPFTTTVTCDTPGATLAHTTDGSTPTLTNGTLTAAPDPDSPPQLTLTVSETTTLRAAAFKDGHAPSNTDTQTYLFLADVRTQDSDGLAPAGWPRSAVNGQVFNYGMDPDVTNRFTEEQFAAAMTDIPTISMVTDIANFTDPDHGFWVNAENRGPDWERPVSVELIDPQPDALGFQLDAGVRVRGGWSRQGGNPKHSFHLYFKKRYGTAKLRFPLFGDDGTDTFDRLDLRSSQGGGGSWHWGDSTRATFNRDVFGRHLQRDMGQPYSRSRYYHVYVNGRYFGLFQSQERVDKFYAAEYFGGSPDDYDVMKTRTRPHRVEALDGTPDAWSRLFDAAVAGFASDAAYFAVQGLNPDGTTNPDGENLVDVDNLIDYMLAIFYTGQSDGPVNLGANVPKNFFALRPKDGRFGFRFFVHDNEDSLQSPTTDNTRDNNTGDRLTYFNPKWLHQRLAQNDHYRRRFSDRAHRHLSGDGALAPATADANFRATADQLSLAILGESARWGDARRSSPYLPSDWQSAVDNILNTFIPRRTAVLRGQLRNRGLLSDTTAPALSRPGGQIEPGTRLIITADPGDQVFYTLDGSDPTAPGALPYTPGGNATPQTLVPAESPGWRSLSSATALGDSTQPGGWKGTNYDDAAWLPTTTPAGYGNAGSPIIATQLHPGPDPRNKFPTTYFRRTFDVADPSCVSELTLHLRRDDGAIAYLNGHEIARTNLPAGTVTYATLAESVVAGAAESTFHDFPVDPARLVAGTNLLAIELHQATPGDGDLVLDAELTASCLDGAGIPVNANTTLKARARSGNDWSPLTEATYYVTAPADAGNLRLTELHYNPPGPDEAGEFIEFQNTADHSIHLDGAHFTDGITYTFPADTVLDPGAYLILAKDPSRFAPGLHVLGPYTGNLNNAGETITLQAADNTLITTFTYNDRLPWPESPDGSGPSLTFAGTDPTDPAHWRPSATTNGTPATTDTTPYTGGNLLTYAIAGYQITADGLTVTRNLTADHARVTIQSSNDLKTWTTLTVEPTAESHPTPTTRALDYPLPDPPPPFLRLEVTASQPAE